VHIANGLFSARLACWALACPVAKAVLWSAVWKDPGGGWVVRSLGKGGGALLDRPLRELFRRRVLGWSGNVWRSLVGL
jgi:hypothetical protein